MKKTLLTLSIMLVLFTTKSSACNALFSAYATSFGPPVVQFMDSSFGTSGIVTYLWDFGDGNTSTNQNDVHTYAANGNYYVCLTITDGLGCTDTYCDSVFLIPPPPAVSAYLMADSMYLYNCSAPQVIPFDYYVGSSFFATNDTDFVVVIAYGDGTDTTFHVTLHNNNSFGTVTHSYINSGTYTAQITVTGAGNVTGTAQIYQPIIIASSCGSVTGKVYNDLNGNCAFDPGEALAGIPLYIGNGGPYWGYATTDANGDYAFNVPVGPTYNIQINSYGGITGHFTPTCPASGTIAVATVPSSGNDFGVACPAGFDLQATVTTWGLRPGSTRSVCVYAYNQFCNSPNGQIEVTLDPLLTPLADTSGIGYTIVGNSVILPTSSTDLYWSFCFPVVVDSMAQIGDSACITVTINPVTGDSIPANNVYNICFPIRNSFDPNDKYAHPEGVGSAGYVLPNTTLDYTIRFQNTGNDYAEDVYILDSLDGSLDPTSVEVIGSSHPMTYSLLAGNIMRFTFDNIMLDDSTTNEPGSHGYVSYRVKMNTNLPQWTEIHNTAGIYFDFNPPIITNTTLHTIDNTLAVKEVENNSLISLYPNPAHDKCYMYFKDNSRKMITMVDALGKEVLNETISADNYVMNTSKLAVGIYTIRIVDENKNADAYKLIIN